MKIPWLLMTGTKDLTPIGDADMNSRLAVYPALHGAAKYEVVLHNAEHSVFTDRPSPGDREPRNPNHRRVILAVSTAFWDAYLRGDAEALAWLNSSGPRSVMEPDDHCVFQHLQHMAHLACRSMTQARAKVCQNDSLSGHLLYGPDPPNHH